MKLIAACLCLAATAESDPPTWVEYKKQFKKSYGSAEEDQRRQDIYHRNLASYAHLNAQEPLAHYGATRFSDMETSEYLNGYKHEDIEMPDLNFTQVGALASRDWTGIYTSPIRDQGECGSCWAQSATSQVESDAMRQHGWKGILSTQEANDCEETGQGSWRGGCDGGNVGKAYQVFQAVGGVASGWEWPSYGRNRMCEINNHKKYVRVDSYSSVGRSDEVAMKNYVSSTGPLSVCVDASSWSGYKSGIKTTCGTSIDHCVQIVGYGVENGVEYWKVRNSWGLWGEKGHIRLKMGSNLCKISAQPTATSTTVIGGNAIKPATSCVDRAGWVDSEGEDCDRFQLNGYCKSDRTPGLGWNTCSWGTIQQYAAGGYNAYQACCACGGGSTVSEVDTTASEVDTIASEEDTTASEEEALLEVAVEEDLTGCTDYSGYRTSEGDDCCVYPWQSYCTSTGGYGPGWKSEWGTFKDYADKNGVTVTQACCGCGGGNRQTMVTV